jgi:hypothetical protein
MGIWKFTRDAMARGIAGTVSSWQYGIDGLAAVAARFRNIQVENYPAIASSNCTTRLTRCSTVTHPTYKTHGKPATAGATTPTR